MQHNSMSAFGAEFGGTFWLVLGGCGSAVLAATHPVLGIGFAGVSLAFGLALLGAAYAFGPISGGHFNPAVSVGMAVAGRFPWRSLPSYLAAQLLGAIAAAAVLWYIATGRPGAELGSFATNGFGAHSPGHYTLASVAACELVMTALFVLVILCVTARNAAPGFGGLAIGLTLAMIHLVSIPVSNTSVNPARSTGVALFAPAHAVSQLWLFWLAPIAGAVIGALAWRALRGDRLAPADTKAAEPLEAANHPY